MDENQIGPNMHTTPMQRYVRDGPYPSGKAVPCNLKVLGSNPVASICSTIGRTRDTMGKLFFCFFFVLTLSSLFGTPENARFLPTCGPPRRQGLGIQF